MYVILCLFGMIGSVGLSRCVPPMVQRWSNWSCQRYVRGALLPRAGTVRGRHVAGALGPGPAVWRTKRDVLVVIVPYATTTVYWFDFYPI